MNDVAFILKTSGRNVTQWVKEGRIVNPKKVQRWGRGALTLPTSPSIYMLISCNIGPAQDYFSLN
jgi:hypothetical protein